MDYPSTWREQIDSQLRSLQTQLKSVQEIIEYLAPELSYDIVADMLGISVQHLALWQKYKIGPVNYREHTIRLWMDKAEEIYRYWISRNRPEWLFRWNCKNCRCTVASKTGHFIHECLDNSIVHIGNGFQDFRYKYTIIRVANSKTPEELIRAYGEEMKKTGVSRTRGWHPNKLPIESVDGRLTESSADKWVEINLQPASQDADKGKAV